MPVSSNRWNFRWVQLGSFMAVMLAVAPVLAKGSGITGYSGKSGSSCSGCHGSSAVSGIAISGPTSLTPGSTGSYTLTITRTSSTEINAGLDVAASGGALTTDPAESQTSLASGEIVHTSPKSGGAAVSFAFRWTAPASAGSFTLYAAGVRGNGHGDTGDETGKTTFSISVAAAATPDAKVPLPDAKPAADSKATPKPDAKAAPKPDQKALLPDASAPKADGAPKVADAKPALADAKPALADAKPALADAVKPAPNDSKGQALEGKTLDGAVRDSASIGETPPAAADGSTDQPGSKADGRASSPSSDGCSCGLASAGAGPGLPAALALLALVAFLRRRR